MPCDSNTTQTVSLAKAIPAVMADALKAAGWTLTQNTPTEIQAYNNGSSMIWTAGKGMTINGSAGVESSIIRAYSKAAVSWAAQRAGWQVSSTDGNKMTLTRR